jgi:TRAP-type C4-dicarboxylate transport system substrate-binding protein
MTWWWLKSLLSRSDDRHRTAADRLRQVEHEEEEAMKRMIDAGVQVTMHADTQSEAMDELIEKMERRKNDGDRVLMTADQALRLLLRSNRT